MATHKDHPHTRNRRAYAHLGRQPGPPGAAGGPGRSRQPGPPGAASRGPQAGPEKYKNLPRLLQDFSGALRRAPTAAPGPLGGTRTPDGALRRRYGPPGAARTHPPATPRPPPPWLAYPVTGPCHRFPSPVDRNRRFSVPILP
jgi:hypothetical protein